MSNTFNRKMLLPIIVVIITTLGYSQHIKPAPRNEYEENALVNELLNELIRESAEKTMQYQEDSLLMVVKGIPLSKTKDNLMTYQQLLAIRPENKLYRQKVKYYQTVFEENQLEIKKQELKNKIQQADNNDAEEMYKLYLQISQYYPENEGYIEQTAKCMSSK